MSILVPGLFLISGILAVMIVLFQNLLRLEREACAAWRVLQEKRQFWLETILQATLLIPGTNTLEVTKMDNIKHLIEVSRKADCPLSAAMADTALTHAWDKINSAQKLTSTDSLDDSCQIYRNIQEADEIVRALERRYNNSATLYNNAGITFPALLIAKYANYKPQNQYHPQHTGDFRGKLSDADTETLAEKSPHIMNAYMLWAVGMSDSTMEQPNQAIDVVPNQK